MSIFRRDAEETVARPSSPASPGAERRLAAATHIAAGTRVTGQINGTTDLLIDGELEGQVRLDSLVTVGAEGTVRGDIAARHVRIGGRVVGNVQGLEKVEVLATGRLEGDISAPRVVLAEGAFFKGRVEMSGSRQDGERRPRPPEEGGEAQRPAQAPDAPHQAPPEAAP